MDNYYIGLLIGQSYALKMYDHSLRDGRESHVTHKSTAKKHKSTASKLFGDYPKRLKFVIQLKCAEITLLLHLPVHVSYWHLPLLCRSLLL